MTDSDKSKQFNILDATIKEVKRYRLANEEAHAREKQEAFEAYLRKFCEKKDYELEEVYQRLETMINIEGTTLIAALQEWGNKGHNYEMTTWDKDDIHIWFEHDIYGMYDGDTYKAVHNQSSTYEDYFTHRKIREPEGADRLETLLCILTKTYPNIWHRTDWSVTLREGYKA